MGRARSDHRAVPADTANALLQIPGGANLVEDATADQVLLSRHPVDRGKKASQLRILDRLALIARGVGTAERMADGFAGEMQLAGDRADRVALGAQGTNRCPDL
jgi:hypothetical protein